MELSRRHFLRLGLWTGAAALLVGGPTVWVQSDESAVLDALADRLFAEADGTDAPMPKPSSFGAGARAWAYVAVLPATARWQVRGLLRLVEWAGVVSGGARFTRLAAAEQDRLLDRLAAGGQGGRLALGALKQLCAMGTFTHSQTWTAIGYDGPRLPQPPSVSP
jgi:Gluconate 2-dehydrogenase subunit 3